MPAASLHTGSVQGHLAGRVFVVAGEEGFLCDVAAAVAAGDARVAVVSTSLDETATVNATVRFRANPRDRDVWDRVAMHIEQHLGPVDGVVTDEGTHPVVDAVFAADLARRGHGTVVVATGADDVASVVTRLCGTPPAAPPRPGDGARRQ